MNKRKNLKGFTLTELIIVMAIFGILMTAALQIITPLNKLSKRASIQEANAAAVDNFKTYLEGTLRYSDCIEVFVGGLTANDATPLSAIDLMNKYGVKNYLGEKSNLDKSKQEDRERAAVIQFIDNHYTNRTNPGTNDPLTGRVRMLKIDNANGGLVSEYEWGFTAGYMFKQYDTDGEEESPERRVNAQLSATPKVNASVINPAYYEDYSFFITPGYNNMEVLADKSIAEGFVFDDDTATDYYASVEKIASPSGALYSDFSVDMFSLSVVAYRNGVDGRVYRGSIPDDTATSSINEYRDVFKAPFDISNVNMSLVNIKSEFSQNRASDMYGPERRNGKPKDASETYTPLTKVEGVGGNWKYEAITSDDAPQIAHRLCPHSSPNDGSNDDCIYFIYTLPDYK